METLEGEPVAVDKNLKDPALTRTSRQVREETIRIWYFRNWFTIYVESCDSSVLVAFTKHIERYQEGREKVDFTQFADGECNWAGLMNWCKSVWAGEIPTMGEGQMPDEGYEMTIDAALGIAKACRGVDWMICEKALETYRPVAGVVDQDWFKD